MGSAVEHVPYYTMEVGRFCASAGGGLPRVLGCGRQFVALMRGAPSGARGPLARATGIHIDAPCPLGLWIAARLSGIGAALERLALEEVDSGAACCLRGVPAGHALA
eukprot:11468800-Alexandrium_andersonii.AAC.1